jgi:pimeloyl-ACP methyl ester carboxylesterase
VSIMKKLFYILPAWIFLAAGVSCVSCFSTPVPLRLVHHQEKMRTGCTLVVFLPGNQSTPEEFEKEGFVSLLKKYRPGVDSMAVDAPIGYYAKEMLPQRLLEDVIKPARLKGYRKIWLVGVSMGGSGALWYLKTYPATIQGVLLLAPFIADKKIVEEIEGAGGLTKWSPAAHSHPDKKDYQRAQLLWLKQYIKPRPPLPLLSLGFGESDRFEQSNRLIAAVLPARNVFTMRGGHEWKTWREIFEQFLKSGLML